MLPIITARLALRPLDRRDLDALAEAYLDPLVDRWIGPDALQDVEQEIRRQIDHQRTFGRSRWAVEERATKRFIGDCGLQPLEHRGPGVELGYDLHPNALSVVSPPRPHARLCGRPFRIPRDRPRRRVVTPGNVASQRVLERAGLQRAGTREAYGEPMLQYVAHRG